MLYCIHPYLCLRLIVEDEQRLFHPKRVFSLFVFLFFCGVNVSLKHKIYCAYSRT